MKQYSLHEVKTKKEYHAFFTFPFTLYKGCDQWVPPITSEEKAIFNRAKNPVFENADAKLFVVKNGKQIVGRIAALLSSIPGASAYFFGGIVAYKPSVKSKVLGVSAELIASHSVVSEEVALAMAKGVRNQMKSDYAIATTGNAGPTKGDSDAEVGTVCIALVGPDFERVEFYNFGKNREKTVQKAVNKALELARKMLM